MILQNKTVLITGGTGALGHVVAEHCLREGANVATSFLSETELTRLEESFRKNFSLGVSLIEKSRDNGCI